MGTLFFNLDVKAQNQDRADSLINVYKTQDLPDNEKLETLQQIFINHPSPDSVSHYANIMLKSTTLESNPDYISSAYLNLGHAARTRGDLEKALEYFAKVNAIGESQNDFENIAISNTAIGDVYAVQGNAKNALQYYNIAISYFRRSNDPVELATVLLNVGDLYLSEDILDSAFIFFEEAGAIFEEHDVLIGKAYYVGNVGLVYAKQGKYQEAEQKIAEATQILEMLGDKYPISVYETYLADIYKEKNQLNKALEHAHLALSIAESEGLKEQIRDASLKLSELYQINDDFENALIYMQQFQNYKDSINNAETIQNLADLRTEMEVEKKQNEVDLLNKSKQVQQTIGVGLVIVLILLLVLAYILFKNNRKEQKINKVLSDQKEQITTQRDELVDLNATKDKFFSIISHDLRGPVNAFQGIAYIVNTYMKQGKLDKIPEMLEMVEKSSDQLANLLDNLLNWALSQQGRFPYMPERLVLNHLLEELIEIFRNMADAKSIELVYENGERIEIWGDRNSIMAIFRNLINNGLKFTPENGKIFISAFINNDHCAVSVQDNGVGMSPEIVDKMFSVNDKKSSELGTKGEKGSGLGLVICKEFTDLNNGKIEVDSEPGNGTTFTVSLPLFQNQMVTN